jgi:hypothetical protein
MFTNVCVPWKAEHFGSRVGTEREESEREGESAVTGAREPPAPSCVRKQKSEPKIASGALPRRARAECPLLGSAQWRNMPRRGAESSLSASANRRNIPQSFTEMSPFRFHAQCRNMPRIGAECLLLGSEQLRDRPPGSAECPFQVWEG